MFQILTANFCDMIRHDQMAGRNYIVVPMIMMTEGVHDGSNGPLLYPADELEKTPEIWNNKPVVVNHPSKNGQGISACSPIVMSTRSIGVIMNTHFSDGKLKAEAWLEIERIKKVDDRILNMLEENKMIEVSTGLYTDHEKKEGSWGEDKEKYTAIARNYRPDHLAVLPDLKGACSIEDGAGLLRLNFSEKYAANTVNALVANEMSHSTIWSLLNSYLAEVREDAWVQDVYDSFFVFADGGDLLKQNYAIKDGFLEISNETIAVVQVTEYRTAEGSEFVGNENITETERKDLKMKKDELIAGLIANEKTKWTEEDSNFLNELEPERLQQMLPVEDQTANKEVVSAVPAVPAVSAVPAVPAVKIENVDEYIANAPEALQGPLRDMQAAHDAEKDEHIKTILANERNAFTEEHLKEKDLDELRALSMLAMNTLEQQPKQHTRRYNFKGMGNVPAANEHVEEPMIAPVLNFRKVAASA